MPSCQGNDKLLSNCGIEREEGCKVALGSIPNASEKFTPRNRFNYWFDNRMSRGALGLIRVLIAASVMFAVIVAGLIVLMGFNGEGEVASVFWDGIATVINAEMPTFEEGGFGYLVLMSAIAIAGVLFTSVLIGIFTSAIEERINDLKRGNSLVLEKDHIVVLGFHPNEYTLLRELILAAAGKPACIVVAENMERAEMEQKIIENLTIPDNVRIVCRTADITDPASLEKCSVETCRTIIVNPTDDLRTIKSILAVSALLDEKGVPEISVNAIISKTEYRFPPSIAEANNISTLETNRIIAKMIAHSCTQTGLSEAFREVFNFEGSEFYLTSLSGVGGLRFDELMARVEGAVPIGFYRDGAVLLNPAADCVLREDDRILIFSEESDCARLVMAPTEPPTTIEARMVDVVDTTRTVIIGSNETLPIILTELPENVSCVYLAGERVTEQQRGELEEIAAGRNLVLKTYEGNLRSEPVLLGLAQMAEHIVILNDHDRDVEEADMEAMFLLLNLRDIRRRYGMSFNITCEMQKEHNQRLVMRGDHTDFLVASRMSSLILAQLAENPELIDVFREILSNRGNELYLKDVSMMGLEGSYTVRDLRQIMLRQGYILLGHLDADKRSMFNPPLSAVITLASGDNLIVLGEK